MTRASFEVVPSPGERHDIIDALEVGVHRHMVHAVLERDVTRARQLIRDRVLMIPKGSCASGPP